MHDLSLDSLHPFWILPGLLGSQRPLYLKAKLNAFIAIFDGFLVESPSMDSAKSQQSSKACTLLPCLPLRTFNYTATAAVQYSGSAYLTHKCDCIDEKLQLVYSSKHSFLAHNFVELRIVYQGTKESFGNYTSFVHQTSNVSRGSLLFKCTMCTIIPRDIYLGFDHLYQLCKYIDFTIFKMDKLIFKLLLESLGVLYP